MINQSSITTGYSGTELPLNTRPKKEIVGRDMTFYGFKFLIFFLNMKSSPNTGDQKKK